MEQTTKKTRAGSPNKTWCGVPIALYRRKKKELSKEEFRQWWLKKTGRSLCLRDDKKKPAANESNWSYIRRLEKELANAKADVAVLQIVLRDKTELVQKLENRSWISRLFNSKV